MDIDPSAGGLGHPRTGQPGSVETMRAVVLQGPIDMPPDQIMGPFESTAEARGWVEANPREDGFSVIQEVPLARTMRPQGV